MMSMTHAVYLITSVAAVVWVAFTLRRRGEVFLMARYRDNELLAASFSHLLSVGFYLVHVGGVMLTLRFGGHADDTTELIEVVSTKVGLVLVTLAVSHFAHLWFFVSSARTSRTYIGSVNAAAMDAEVIEA